VAFPDPRDRTPTILIVEDELLVRMALSEYLQHCGFKVLEARDADEAVAILDKTSATIDLVFSDVQMPGSLDGFGLAQWIRKTHPRLPVILTSGDARKVSTANELCANEPFMTKPYDLAMVVAQIRNHVGIPTPEG
jgi:DNA-binding response OmpR family regulator